MRTAPGRSMDHERPYGEELMRVILHAPDPWHLEDGASALPCGRFHGCPTLGDRNVTLAVAQYCVTRQPHEMTPAMRSTCAGELFASPATPHAPWCGFASGEALAYMDRLRSIAGHCKRVLFAVVIGGHEAVQPVQGTIPDQGCAVAIVDFTSQRRWHALRFPRWRGWTLVRLPDSLHFDYASRFAKIIRFGSSRMFPNASMVMYVDGFMHFGLPIDDVFRYVAKRTSKPWVALAHTDPTRDSLHEVFVVLTERFKPRKAGLEYIRNASRAIEEQRFLYGSEGAWSRENWMIEGQLFLQQRRLDADPVVPVARRPPKYPGMPVADATVIARWMDCAQMVEVSALSWRTQLNWIYVVNLLGVRQHVHVVTQAEKRGLRIRRPPHKGAA